MTKDNINPNHYKAGGIETIDLIQDVVADFGSVCQANILKYGIRANKKHDEPQDDIKKIIQESTFLLSSILGKEYKAKLLDEKDNDLLNEKEEEIAVFDKLNSLLTPQEKEFLKNRNINCVMIDGGEIFKSVISDFIDKLGDEENGE